MADIGTTPTKSTGKNRATKGVKKTATRKKPANTNSGGNTGNTGNTDWPENKALPINIALRGFDQVMAKYIGVHGFTGSPNQMIAYRQSLERQTGGQRSRGAAQGGSNA